MPAATLVPIIVTEDWTRPDGTTPTGSVRFDLLDAIISPEYVAPTVEQLVLTQGAIAQQLVALDADSNGDPLTPSTLQYEVSIDILGAPLRQFFITVPAQPPGSRTVNDATTEQGEQTVTSATADFTDDDVGSYVLLAGFPAGTTIQSVQSSTEATLGSSASVTASGVSLLIGASVTLSALDPDV